MTLLHGDCLELLKTLEPDSVDSLVTDPPAGISFMGKSWDSDKGGRQEWTAWMESVMRECLRVLKPGAHGLVWAIPRTSHWTMTALEDAGFEVRDVCTHLFGQGFPKSLDISKAIDKAAGAEREKLGVAGKSGSKRGSMAGDFKGGEYFATAPATAPATAWQGWGTALKPAAEFWILVRKPCSEKTVAANVLKWGTGGLNIDGSRIASSDKLGRINNVRKGASSYNLGKSSQELNTSDLAGGRFPANLILGDDDILGEQSRFFYCAKISSGERGEGNSHPTVKPQKLMRYLCRMITPPGGVVLDPFMGSGSTGLAALSEGFRFVGMEREREYLEISSKRMEAFSA